MRRKDRSFQIEGSGRGSAFFDLCPSIILYWRGCGEGSVT